MGNKKLALPAFLKKIPLSLLVLLSFLLFAAYLYAPSFNSFFFQDDWFTFKISQVANLSDFFNFFLPRDDVIYYRPVGMQLYFFVMHTIFGYNAFYYRIATLIVYSLHGLIIFNLLLTLGFKRLVSFFSSLFFISSVATYIPFFWSATFPFVLGPFFCSLTFLLFLKKEEMPFGYWASFLTYLLASLTLENSLVLPFILGFYLILRKSYKKILTLGIFIFPQVVIIILRLFIFKIPLSGVYEPDLRLLSTIRNYIFWSLNWPEEIGRQFVGPLTINKLFISDFSSFYNIWSAVSIILILIFFFLLIFFFTGYARSKAYLYKNLLLGIIWYTLALLPLLIFADHTFPYYLPLPHVGISIILAVLFTQVQGRLSYGLFIALSLVTIILYFISGLATVSFNSLTHWAPQRAVLSYNALNRLHEDLSYGDTAVIKASEEYKLPLNNTDSLELYFGSNVKIIYSDDSDYLKPQQVGVNQLLIQ